MTTKKSTNKPVKPTRALASKPVSHGERCQYAGCGKRFKRVGRQAFCSPRCRAAAFYWRYKEEHGERYAARYESQTRKPSKRRVKPKSARKPR